MEGREQGREGVKISSSLQGSHTWTEKEGTMNVMNVHTSTTLMIIRCIHIHVYTCTGKLQINMYMRKKARQDIHPEQSVIFSEKTALVYVLHVLHVHVYIHVLS